MCWIYRFAFAVRDAIDLREWNFALIAIELTHLQHLRTIYFGGLHLINEVRWNAQYRLVVAVDVFEGLGGEIRNQSKA